jgi:hypothetical protein
MMLAAFIQLAYEESKQKAERVAESWGQRRKRAREKGELLTTRLPAWLEIVNGEVRPIPERAAAMKRIFRLSAEGKGHTGILTALIKEGIKAFGERRVNPERSRSQFSGRWTRPYIANILNDRRAVGEFQPRKIDGTPDGPPLPGYYPAVISEQDYLLARAGQEERMGRDRRGNTIVGRQVKYVNAFKSLLRHARDGEGFILHNKGKADRPELLLINTTGGDGRSPCYTFPYLVFEKAVLDLLREVRPEGVFPKGREAPDTADVLRAKLANVRQDIARLQADLKEGYSKSIVAALREREDEEERIAEELQKELARAIKPAAHAMKQVPSLVKLIEKEGDEARLKMRPVLRRVVEEAWVLVVPRKSWRLCAVQLFFSGGARRDYLIAHQTAAYRRPGGWWARSLASVVKPGELDLRKRDHAKRLEKALSEVELG